MNQLATEQGITHLTLRGDSNLVTQQLLGRASLKAPNLLPLFIVDTTLIEQNLRAEIWQRLSAARSQIAQDQRARLDNIGTNISNVLINQSNLQAEARNQLEDGWQNNFTELQQRIRFVMDNERLEMEMSLNNQIVSLQQRRHCPTAAGAIHAP
jgi:hypothetical protein